MGREFDNWLFWGALFLGILLAFSPLVARISAGDPSAPLPESYYHKRMAQLVQDGPFPLIDPLQDRQYEFNLYHYILALAPESAAIPLILSLATILLFYAALTSFGMTRRTASASLLVLVLSPVYVYSSSAVTPVTLNIFLASLSLYLYATAKKTELAGTLNFFQHLAFFPAALIALSNPSAFLAFLLATAALFNFLREDMKKVLSLLVMGVAASSVAYAFLGYNPFPHPLKGFSINFVTDFGAVLGYSFFTLLLAFVTVAFLWGAGANRKLLDFALLILIAVSALFPGSRGVLTLALSIYAAMAALYFMERKWALPVLRDITMLLFFSGLLFSSLSYANRLSSSEPSSETVKLLEIIGETGRQGEILSHPGKGFLVEYFAGRPAFLDDRSQRLLEKDEYRDRLDTYRGILSSRSPSRTKELLDRYGVSYIYLDDSLRGEGAEGLFLVLEVSENFIGLGEIDGREAWLYLKV